MVIMPTVSDQIITAISSTLRTLYFTATSNCERALCQAHMPTSPKQPGVSCRHFFKVVIVATVLSSNTLYLLRLNVNTNKFLFLRVSSVSPPEHPYRSWTLSSTNAPTDTSSSIPSPQTPLPLDPYSFALDHLFDHNLFEGNT